MNKRNRLVLTIVLLLALFALNYFRTLNQSATQPDVFVEATTAVFETQAATELQTEVKVTEAATEEITEKATEAATEEITKKETEAVTKAQWHQFANKKLYEEHYQKHVITQQEFGDISKEEYLQMANDLINAIGVDPEILTKSEKDDGDLVVYRESTNEFAILRQDGVIRTYFKPSAGIDYYNRQ